MTVAELIAQLQEYDDEVEVKIEMARDYEGGSEMAVIENFDVEPGVGFAYVAIAFVTPI